MAETEFVLKLNPRDFEAKAKKTKITWGKAVDDMKRAASGLGKAYVAPMVQAEEAANSFGKAFAIDSRKIRAEAAATSSSLALMAKRVGLIAVAYQTAQSGKESIRSFADFEKGLIGVGKTADIEGGKLAQFGDDIQALSKEIPVSTADLLELSQAAGQLGVKGTKNLLQFSRVMAELASASDVQGESGALQITRILGITKEDIGQVDQFSNVLVGLGNSVRASESEILSVATRVAQSTSAFKLSSTEILGISAGLKGLGVEAEVAGSSTLKAFTAIKDAIDGGGESLTALEQITGQTREQLSQLFATDQAALFQEFIKGLNGVKESGGDVINTLKALGIQETRAISTLATAANGYGDYADAIERANIEAEKNNARINEAEKAFGSLDAKIDKSAGSLSRAGEELGELFAPFAADTLSLASKLLDGMAGNIEKINKELRNEQSTLSKWAETTGDIYSFILDGTFGFFNDDVTGIAEALLYPISTFEELTEAANTSSSALKRSAEEQAEYDKRLASFDELRKSVGLHQKLGEVAEQAGKAVKVSFEAQAKDVSQSIKAQTKALDKQIDKLQDAADKARQFREDLDEAIKANNAGPAPSDGADASSAIVRVRRASTKDSPEETLKLGREALDIITKLRDDGVIDESLAGAQLQQLKKITEQAALDVKAKSESAIAAFQQEAEELKNIQVGIDKASAEAAAKGLTLTVEQALARLKIGGLDIKNMKLSGSPSNPANFDPRSNVIKPITSVNAPPSLSGAGSSKTKAQLDVNVSADKSLQAVSRELNQALQVNVTDIIERGIEAKFSSAAAKVN